jgi:hypothetical protein
MRSLASLGDEGGPPFTTQRCGSSSIVTGIRTVNLLGSISR